MHFPAAEGTLIDYGISWDRSGLMGVSQGVFGDRLFYHDWLSSEETTGEARPGQGVVQGRAPRQLQLGLDQLLVFSLMLKQVFCGAQHRAVVQSRCQGVGWPCMGKEWLVRAQLLQ